MWYYFNYLILRGDDIQDGAQVRQELSQMVIRLWDLVEEACLSDSEVTIRHLLATCQEIESVAGKHFLTQHQVAKNLIGSDLDQERLSHARQLVDDVTDAEWANLGTQVPRFLVQYIDRFVDRARWRNNMRHQHKITKQKLIIEALCLFYSVHRLPDDVDQR